MGNSLVAQWLGLNSFTPGTWVQSLVGELRPCGPIFFFKVKVKVTQSCPTLCDSMDYRVHGILQARILEWVPFNFSGGSSQPRSPALQVL